MKFFLKIKHWQLFCLLVIVPIILQILWAGAMTGALLSKSHSLLFSFLMIIPFGLLSFLYFGWFYTLGNNLHKKLPENIKTNKLIFNIFIIYIIIYFFSFLSLMSAFFQMNQANIPDLFDYILPFHLFCMACMLYCLIFIAKTMKSVE